MGRFARRRTYAPYNTRKTSGATPTGTLHETLGSLAVPPFLGLLAYWIVNIIRHQLKKKNEKRKKADPDPKAEYPTPYWTENVDIMKTQKVVKSEAVNTLGEKVEMMI